MRLTSKQMQEVLSSKKNGNSDCWNPKHVIRTVLKYYPSASVISYETVSGVWTDVEVFSAGKWETVRVFG